MLSFKLSGHGSLRVRLLLAPGIVAFLFHLARVHFASNRRQHHAPGQRTPN